MLKKIFIFIIYVFIFFETVLGAKYVSTLTDEQGHKHFEKVTKDIVEKFVDEHPTKDSISDKDIENLKKAVSKAIIDSGGWTKGVKGRDEQTVKLDGNKLVIGCGNVDFGYFELEDSSPPPPPPSPPPPPPLPPCREYVAIVSKTGSCVIDGEWDINGSVNCKQRFFPEREVLYANCYPNHCGKEHIYTLEYYREHKHESELERQLDESLHYFPEREERRLYDSVRGCPARDNFRGQSDKIIKIDLLYNGNTCSNIYANGNSICEINFGLGNVPSEGLSGFDGLDTKNISFSKFNDKLSLYNGSINSSNNLSLRVKSVQPFNENGRLRFKLKGKNEYRFVNYNINLEFKKPIKISSFNTDSGNKIILGKEEKYLIGLENIGGVNFYDGSLSNINTSTIKNLIHGHYWNKFNLLNNIIGGDINNKLSFSGVLDARANTLKSPKLVATGLRIFYKVLGKEVNYVLDDSNELTSCDVHTLGVKVIGLLQGQGKQMLTGQDSNVSDLSQSVLRMKLKRNVYRAILGRESSKTLNINGLMYISGEDVKYSELESYLNQGDTVIVNNGNFIIDKDITKYIGIIVLKDGYNLSNDYNTSGNIYLNKDVIKLNTIIYADGVFRSAKENGDFYSDDELEKQLKLNGSLFTRNTIGGAVVGNTHFILPGGKSISDYNLASIYDLNYVRKVPPECDASGRQIEDSFSFIIKYNPLIQINPPKLFTE